MFQSPNIAFHIVMDLGKEILSNKYPTVTFFIRRPVSLPNLQREEEFDAISAVNTWTRSHQKVVNLVQFLPVVLCASEEASDAKFLGKNVNVVQRHIETGLDFLEIGPTVHPSNFWSILLHLIFKSCTDTPKQRALWCF